MKVVFHAKILWMILVMSKCSIYDVKHPIFLIFRGPQTPHTATIFEKNLGTILFYENKSACHIFGTICDTFRIPNVQFPKIDVIPLD